MNKHGTNWLGMLPVGCVVLLGAILLSPVIAATDNGASDTAADSLMRDIALDHYITGSLSEEAGELLQAAIEYQVARIYDPASAAIATSLADAYVKLGYQGAALKVLEEARASNPDDEELLSGLLRLYLRSGRNGDAVGVFEELNGLRELNRDELLRLAGLYAETGDLHKALERYQECIKRFGSDTAIYERMGLIYLALKDLDNGERVFKELVANDSTEYRILFVLGGFAVAREKWGEAENYFRLALAGDSTNLRFWSNLLMTQDEQGKFEDMVSTVGAAIAKFGDVPQLYNIKATALHQLGRDDEALQALRSSVELDSTSVPPLITMALIHHDRSEWDAAAEAYERALRLDPENPMILNNYAYLLAEQNYRLEDALKMVDLALRTTPDSPSFLDTRGWVLYRTGDFKGALQFIRRALKGEGENAELYYHLGMVYRALGKKSKARKAFAEAARLEPDNRKYSQLAE